MNRIERAGERCWAARDGVVIVDDGDWVTIWESDPATDGRTDHFQDVQVETIDGADHWAHHDQLDTFLYLTRSFLAD